MKSKKPRRVNVKVLGTVVSSFFDANIFRFTSSGTPAYFLMASMAAEPF